MQRLAITLVLFTCALPVLAGQSASRVTSLDKLDVLHEEATLDELVRVAAPWAIWAAHQRMAWVKTDPDGSITFTFNTAVTIERSQGVRWALVRRKADVSYVAELDGEFAHCEARVVPFEPQRDGGNPPHAVAFDKDARGSVLFRARWGTEPTMGNGSYHTLRDVILVRDAKGQWMFIGEGGDVTTGRGGPGWWLSEDLLYRVGWTGRAAEPATITATKSYRVGQMYEVELEPAMQKSELETRHEGTLDPATKQMRWSKQEYMLAEDGESIDAITRKLVMWRVSHFYDNYPERRPSLLEPIRDVVVTLNPKSSLKPKLSRAERVLVPSYDDIRQALRGSPATRPSKRP